MKLQNYYVYILTNRYRRALYIGVTRDLQRRMSEHVHGMVNCFNKQYNLKYLIYFEAWDSAEAAIGREKQLKNWHREWKLNLIRELNPELKDLTDLVC